MTQHTYENVLFARKPSFSTKLGLISIWLFLGWLVSIFPYLCIHKFLSCNRCLDPTHPYISQTNCIGYPIRLELASFKGLSELPTGGYDVVPGDGFSIAGRNTEREALAVEVRIALPILAPIPWHSLPPYFWALYGHCMDIPCPSYICNQNQVEVRMAVYGEPHSSFLHTWYPVKNV